MIRNTVGVRDVVAEDCADVQTDPKTEVRTEGEDEEHNLCKTFV